MRTAESIHTWNRHDRREHIEPARVVKRGVLQPAVVVCRKLQASTERPLGQVELCVSSINVHVSCVGAEDRTFLVVDWAAERDSRENGGWFLTVA